MPSEYKEDALFISESLEPRRESDPQEDPKYTDWMGSLVLFGIFQSIR